MVRFALVHFGNQSAGIARVAPRLRGGEVTAVIEPDAGSARRQAELLKVSAWTTSTQHLHEQFSGAFDAWIASTPYGLLLAPHDNQPLDFGPESWRDNPTAWLWGHPYRFLPSIRTVKESLDSGMLGDPGLLRIHHWLNRSGEHVRQAILPQLDIACWMVNQPPELLFAKSRAEPAVANRDYLQIHLGFADNRMALIDCATSLRGGDEYYSLSVIASTGAAYADDHHNMQLVFNEQRLQAVRTSQGDHALLATLQEFIDAMAKPRPPSCGAAEWGRALKLSAAIDKSLATGQAVSLAGGAP